MSRVKANTGRLFLGDKELAYCEGIDIDYDGAPINYYAADRRYPLDIILGNSSMTIKVACAEHDVSEEYAFVNIMQSGEPVSITLLEGMRGGGFPATSYNNMVVTNYSVTSKQGDVVKASITLAKRSDS